MKSEGNGYPLLLWAAREILRRPGRNLLLLACLVSLTFLIATALLFSRALDRTWSRLMDQAPDLIVRRVDAGGWAPIPVAAALASAAAVPGSLDPTPRLWGVVPGPQGPVTVTASTGPLSASVLRALTPPDRGQAVVGSGLTDFIQDERLVLDNRLELEVIGTFPAESGLATHDIVWAAPPDVRQLLGIPPGHASDLAVYLFHRQEEEAIREDLAASFPWPVRVVGRSDSSWRHHTQAIRMGGMAVVACVPAVLAMVLIVTATAAAGSSGQPQWGLLKAMGWTTGNIVRLQVIQAAVVGIPAVTLALALAHAAVFHPPTAGIAAMWIGGGHHLPELAFDHDGAAVMMLEIAALVMLPYLAAVYLATVKGVARDPFHLLQENPWT